MLPPSGSQPDPKQFAQDYAEKISEINRKLEDERIEPYPNRTGQPGATVLDRNDYFT
jgi:hypothetical protein